MKKIINKIFKKNNGDLGLDPNESYETEVFEVTDLGSRRQPEAQELKIIRAKINAILYPEAEELKNSENAGAMDVFEEILQLEKLADENTDTEYQLAQADEFVDNSFVENAPEQSSSMLEAFSEFDNTIDDSPVVSESETEEESTLFDDDFLEVDDKSSEYEDETEEDIQAESEAEETETVQTIIEDDDLLSVSEEIVESEEEDIDIEEVESLEEDDLLEVSDESTNDDVELENVVEEEDSILSVEEIEEVDEESEEQLELEQVDDSQNDIIAEEIIEVEDTTVVTEEKIELSSSHSDNQNSNTLQAQVEDNLNEQNQDYLEKRKKYIDDASEGLNYLFKTVESDFAEYKHEYFIKTIHWLRTKSKDASMKYLVNYLRQLELLADCFEQDKVNKEDMKSFFQKEILLSDEDDLLLKINDLAAFNRKLDIKKSDIIRKTSSDFETDKTMIDRNIIRKIDRSKRKVIRKPRQQAQ